MCSWQISFFFLDCILIYFIFFLSYEFWMSVVVFECRYASISKHIWWSKKRVTRQNPLWSWVQRDLTTWLVNVILYHTLIKKTPKHSKTKTHTHTHQPPTPTTQHTLTGLSTYHFTKCEVYCPLFISSQTRLSVKSQLDSIQLLSDTDYKERDFVLI